MSAIQNRNNVRSGRKGARQERWKTVIASCCVIGIVGYLATTIDFSAALGPKKSSESSSSQEEMGAGRIVLQADAPQCQQMKFDNRSGRLSEDYTPCDNQVAFDSRGVPVPRGTIHRLDSISKPFLMR
jgi:hypothetical protein